MINLKDVLFLLDNAKSCVPWVVEKKNCIIHRTSRTLPQQTTLSTITRITTSVGNPSEMRRTCARHVQISLLLRHLFFSCFFFKTRYPASGGTLAKVSKWRWLLIWRLKLCQMFCIPFILIIQKTAWIYLVAIYIYPCSISFVKLRLFICFC